MSFSVWTVIMSIWNRLFGREQIELEDISFDTFGWPEHSRSRQLLIWQAETFPAQLSLNLFNKKPDLSYPIDDETKLRKFYRKKINKKGGGILKIEPRFFRDLQIIETLFKIPMKNEGLLYVGAFTLPFARHSIVVKVQTQEYQHLGLRETKVQERLRQSGELKKDAKGNWIDWERDPYDEEERFGFLMNHSELEAYDRYFPDHPLSVCREKMHLLEKSLQFSEKIHQLEAF